jgi:DNA-binding response OmpR family regulator
VDCLEQGAQDYLTKPFSLAELLARVQVRLRRDLSPHGEVIRCGRLTIDVGRLEADVGHGPVSLTRLEFLLLRELTEHAGRSVPKGRLLASVWGLDFDPGSNVVDVCVRRLRAKLGFDLIKTVRGAGYQLAA